jgi:CRP-like cAMP-binding protein
VIAWDIDLANVSAIHTSSTASMTRVERVMLLRSIPLFKFCSVEETVRIAEIAERVTFSAGQEIFRANESARALYCLVEGRVRLYDARGQERMVGPRDAFGVLEILSGRLRRNTAGALEDTVALAIAADDFFDLLSNNVEIVKALFREILDGEAVQTDREAAKTGAEAAQTPAALL